MVSAAASGGAITVSSATVGQNLENSFLVSVPTGTTCPPSTPACINVTLSSSDNGTQLLIAGRPGATGTNPFTTSVAPGVSITVYAQGLVASGQVTVTATASSFTPGTATVQFTPSGFIIAGPGGIGTATFTTGPRIQTPLSIYSAQLDSDLNFVETMPLRGGISASVNVTSSNTAAGTISSSPLTLTGSQSSAITNFVGAGQGTTTVSASTTTAGFRIPSEDTSLIVTVNPSGLIPGTATVGNGLENTTFIALNGSSPLSGMQIQVTSSDTSKLLLALNSTDAGSGSITLNLPAGYSLTRTQNFYVYGLANSGTVSYTATDISGAGFGNATGTIALAPSAIIVDAGFGPGNTYMTVTGAGPSTVTVESVLLDSSSNYVSHMALAGGTLATINVAESNASGTGVGTISPSSVTITGGNLSTTTEFTPLNPGTALITVSEPAPFSAPNQTTSPYQKIDIQVSTPGFGIVSGISIGDNLEVQGTLGLGAPAPVGGLIVMVQAPSGLLFASADDTIGKSSLRISIPAGGTSAGYIIQAQGSTGTVTYTVSASGYTPRNGTISLTPSGPVLAGNIGLGTGEEFASLSAGATSLTLYMAQLNSDGSFGGVQALAPLASGPVSVSLTSNTTTVGTIQSPVSITGGLASANGVNVTFTPLRQGSTTLSVVKPGGYTLTSTSGYASLIADVVGSTTITTITTLTSSANPSIFGNQVTFTASVNPSSATGSIIFIIDGVSQSPVTLHGGSAAFATSTLSIGSHSVYATYSGDSTYGASTSNTVTQTIRTVTSSPALTITKRHSGTFWQGQRGATYTVSVSNASGAGATSGTVTVMETVPTGLTLVLMSGTGWTCNSNTCTRSDSLGAGASYSLITVTVNVSSNAPSHVINQVMTSGGGSASATTSDPTTVNSSGPDFNGNGVPDIVWQNTATSQVSVWYMGGGGGAVPQSWAWISQSGVPGWRVVAVADFNGDGVPDIVWQNTTTSQVSVWYMGGTGGAVPQSWAWISAGGLPGWTVVAAADFNGDGVPDVVWQNNSTSQVSVWYMGGTGGAIPQSWAWISQTGLAGWRVAGAADFNSDGVPDILWQNSSTGQVSVWYMGGSDGAVPQSWAWISQGGEPGWSVVD